METLNLIFFVSTPSGESFAFLYLCKNVDIEVFGYKMPINLIILKTYKFDVIFEVGWLSKYHNIIDYHGMVVCFIIIGEDLLP